MIPDTDMPIFILGRKVEKTKGKKTICKSYAQSFWKEIFIPPILKSLYIAKMKQEQWKQLGFPFPWGLFLNTL